mmetsp:Transcript_16515/g.50292  ORF Transcript_16515/g.50292 Transcript_16515/m.50292 type:complete len:214 (-) Transcript_16515:809-1450(-)|eukprot:scaffold30763_cov30-Tisochrysis_lutea.AAC.5
MLRGVVNGRLRARSQATANIRIGQTRSASRASCKGAEMMHYLATGVRCGKQSNEHRFPHGTIGHWLHRLQPLPHCSLLRFAGSQRMDTQLRERRLLVPTGGHQSARRCLFDFGRSSTLGKRSCPDLGHGVRHAGLGQVQPHLGHRWGRISAMRPLKRRRLSRSRWRDAPHTRSNPLSRMRRLPRGSGKVRPVVTRLVCKRHHLERLGQISALD